MNGFVVNTKAFSLEMFSRIENPPYMIRTSISLLFLLISLTWASLNAQTVIHNDGETVFISNDTPVFTEGAFEHDGGTVEVNGTLDIGSYETISASTLNNNDTIWVKTGFNATDLTYNGIDSGRLHFVSASSTFSYQGNGNLSTSVLEFDLPGITNPADFGFAADTGNGLIAVDSIKLLNGRIGTGDGFIGHYHPDINRIVVANGGTAYVAGAFRSQGTGDRFFPIGTAAQYYPSTLVNVVGGANSVIEGNVLADAGFSGTDSVGVTNEFAVETGDTVRYAFTQAGGSAVTTIDRVRLAVYDGAQAFGALSSADAKLASRVAYAPEAAGPNGEFHSVGQQNLTNVVFGRDEIVSDSTRDNGLGYYVVARCQALAGLAEAIRPTQCPGETNELDIVGDYDITFDVTWQKATTLVGPWTNLSPGGTPYNLSDTLSQSLFFRAEVSDPAGLCTQRTSEPEEVTLEDALRARLRVFLEGPYIAGEDSMAGVNSAFQQFGSAFPLRTALEDQFLNGTGSAVNTMNPSATIPDTVVDVVRVELWDDISGLGSKISEDSAWINTNGFLTDFKTGGSQDALSFCNALVGNYHILVRHRNHLPIATASVISLNNTDPGVGNELDLSVAANVYQPAINVKEIDTSPVRVGMIAGQVENPVWETVPAINAMDYFFVTTKTTAGIPSTYSTLDANIDGRIEASDLGVTEPNTNDLRYTTLPN